MIEDKEIEKIIEDNDWRNDSETSRYIVLLLILRELRSRKV